MKKKAIAGLIAIVVIAAVMTFVGCVETSLYSVKYSLAEESGGLTVNVSGPADDLAILLTNPKGHTCVRYISKKDMIDNFESQWLPMYKGTESASPPAGVYKLTVKTVTPEKVVYKTEKEFKPAVIRITDAGIELTRGAYRYGTKVEGYRVGYTCTVRNDGELPIVLEYYVIVDSTKFGPYSVGYYDSYLDPGESEILDTEYVGCVYGSKKPDSAKIEFHEAYSGDKVASFEISRIRSH